MLAIELLSCDAIAGKAVSERPDGVFEHLQILGEAHAITLVTCHGESERTFSPRVSQTSTVPLSQVFKTAAQSKA